MDRREFVLLSSAAPFGVRAWLASAPTALVTCDAEARLSVVDILARREVHSIATLPDPRAVELVGDRAVVCHTAVGAVSLVDGRRVRHVLKGFVEPRYVAAHPDGRHAFVTDSGRSGVVAIDVVRGVELGRVRLPGWARHITIDARGERLWVSLGSAAEHVAVVDAAALRHVGTVTPGFPLHDVGRAPDGRLWITSGATRQLAVAGSVHGADLAPQHVTFGDGHAFVTSGDAGTLHVQTLDGTVVRTAQIPVGSYNVQYGRGYVLTASLLRGTLSVLDRSGRLMGVAQVSKSCHDACFSPI
jgi:DNA-binding beta-propeller fold protein YncE